MDDLDRRLITILRHDGRRSISDLALDLGVSRATVRARIERLERAGEIVGYTVVLRADATSPAVRGLTLIEVEGRRADDIIAALTGFPEVGAVHTTSGRWDIIAEILTETLTGLDAVLNRIRQIPGVTASETHLLLATPRSTKARL
ncbi:Lrp/AsnC family transcriptional regulator [Methylobacterium sp. ID0610]|uniref:Lrp/AsnC family transcriptional regulator n=1 Tax=Methylobacterium carpenticola TaxID=3344827 RepID=UPI0036C51536